MKKDKGKQKKKGLLKARASAEICFFTLDLLLKNFLRNVSI